MSMKFYILTSRSLPALQRHFSEEYSNIPKDDAVVVINTLDEEYSILAASYCEDEGIEYHITESNGTPARGKNIMLDLFVQSDNEYMVQIDGDDYLTPHGVWMYSALAKRESPPDAICLKNQLSVIIDYPELEILMDENPDIKYTPETVPWGLARYFVTDWDRLAKTPLYPSLIELGVEHESAEEQSGWNKEFFKLQKKYCEDNESHCRVTFMSKKAAAAYKFPEHLVVGEDTVFYFLLKHEGLTGNMEVLCSDDLNPSYIYDQRMPGTVYGEVKGGTDWSWMKKYNDAVHELEEKGLVHEEELPILKVDYPWDYEADCLKLVPSYAEYGFSFRNDDGEISGNIQAPSNASKKSLEERFDKIYADYK